MRRYAPGRCRLHQLYVETGITQVMVSDLTGIPESQLSDYANNRTKMGLGTAYTIAKAMKLPNSDLLYEWELVDGRRRGK